jgi:hypothetical protein
MLYPVGQLTDPNDSYTAPSKCPVGQVKPQCVRYIAIDFLLYSRCLHINKANQQQIFQPFLTTLRNLEEKILFKKNYPSGVQTSLKLQSWEKVRVLTLGLKMLPEETYF